jgi:hypothetical protein
MHLAMGFEGDGVYLFVETLKFLLGLVEGELRAERWGVAVSQLGDLEVFFGASDVLRTDVGSVHG